MSISRKSPSPLTINDILAWADAHHRRTGKWPRRVSGQVFAARRYTWKQIDDALQRGNHGLAGGSSIAKLLYHKRNARYQRALPPLRIKQILAWADAHHAKTGQWPNYKSGPVLGGPAGEAWRTVHFGLYFAPAA